jgi:hypothetical protein
LQYGYTFYDPVYAVIETNYGEVMAVAELSPDPSNVKISPDSPTQQKSRLWTIACPYLSSCGEAQVKIDLLTAIAGFMAVLHLKGVRAAPNSFVSWARRNLAIELFKRCRSVNGTSAFQQDLWIYEPQQKDFLIKLSRLDELEVHLALANCNLRGLGIPQELRQV